MEASISLLEHGTLDPYFFFTIIYFSEANVHVPTRAMKLMWRSEGNSQESLFSFQESPVDQIRVVDLGKERLCPLNRLTIPPPPA